MSKKNTKKSIKVAHRKDNVKSLPKCVLVIWEDAVQVGEDSVWITNKTYEYKPCIFHQVGFLIGDYEEGIQLCDTWGTDLISNPTQIPRGMILSIQEIVLD